MNHNTWVTNFTSQQSVEQLDKKSNTRQLQVPFNKKKTQGDRGFSFTGPNYWNKLPDNIKEAENIGKLKKNSW